MESSSAAAFAEIFARAAQYLSSPQGAAPPDDVAALLRTVEYESEAGGSELVANRIALLRAAARFARVFQLGAPEAPGLVFLGAEVNPGMVSAGHAQAALPGVGGMGLSMRAAFESCIGEGVELLSQFETGDEPLLASSAGAILDAAKGEGRSFLESLLSGIEKGARLDCLAATGLTSDNTILVPAEICLRRPRA
jgi:ribosomal protein S12 methylthiotransferase accessory factor